ncbi:polysaccharide deacetylase family protein [Paenibacillus macquariensis]|uniref:Peptidoglycan/xylan/chitin deacetylase, PgdA/CDA1 family n=1 Tax=Paenibacillus macquariensis TaxID=948756 RepID=A0ABY1K1Z7_9BACL|nr:polysaccharide deacetylase family protein [Paenibacillus macquariensis]MEC0091691.1 polysaccharide deacetylase family protein [Paenibacillus macquariensis]OAB32382.1 xylanase deacetylase [Paenibacillus macquariensis subsp. macquariensis]SIR13930.1 Peptidoglycan/xylan/chitin deacetylase, PgdA/CDA1 family [Paenibacillus macquariensis]
MQTLLLWLFYISSFYAFIPGMITRIFGFRVFRKGKSEHAFALTFDDGPDPHYTPQLLDILKRYNAKGTFFVVGKNAEQHPELIQRMYDEGHLIGIHNYIHKSNWIMRPATVRNQIQKTDEIIYAITGERTSYYRPPWGIVNLFDFSKHNQFKIILWSAMFGDWREKMGSDKLAKRMLNKLKPGEIMLLHDCGSTVGANLDAPKHMLIALEQVLEEAQRRNLQSIRIDEMIQASAPEIKLSRWKLAVVKLWLMWEVVFHFIFQLKTVTPADPFLHYRVRAYKGEALTLDNGSRLEKGDAIIELHFDNQKLFKLGVKSRSTVHLAIQMIRSMEKELPILAQQLMENDELRDAKALYGVSMINRGPEKFGFSIRDLPEGWFAKSTQVYLKILMRIIHPAGQDRLKESPSKLVPKMIIMPLEHLYEHHAVSGSHRCSNPTKFQQVVSVDNRNLKI